jgi:hypothetical protein
LKKQAQLPIVLPEWEQTAVEQMCERDDRAMRHIPAVLQSWRTMCLIRSFHTVENSKATSLQGTFEDLAATTLLARNVFREGGWFPSAQKIFEELPEPNDRTGLINETCEV